LKKPKTFSLAYEFRNVEELSLSSLGTMFSLASIVVVAFIVVKIIIRIVKSYDFGRALVNCGVMIYNFQMVSAILTLVVQWQKKT
jgi:hypothetical protein